MRYSYRLFILERCKLLVRVVRIYMLMLAASFDMDISNVRASAKQTTNHVGQLDERRVERRKSSIHQPTKHPLNQSTHQPINAQSPRQLQAVVGGVALNTGVALL